MNLRNIVLGAALIMTGVTLAMAADQTKAITLVPPADMTAPDTRVTFYYDACATQGDGGCTAGVTFQIHICAVSAATGVKDCRDVVTTLDPADPKIPALFTFALNTAKAATGYSK